MNGKLFGLIALAVMGMAVLASACGGEEEGEAAAIRTGKGLVVAALSPQGGFAGGAVVMEGGGAPAAAPIAQPVPIPAARGGDIGFAGGFSYFQQGMTGINVQGFGSATADADSATLQLFVVGQGYYGPYPVKPPPVPGETGLQTPPELPPSQPLTEEDLAPIVEAIGAQGIAEGDIEVNLNPGGYYDPYGPGRASITVTLSDPRSAVQPIVEAARAAATASGSLFLESVNVRYSVSPEMCSTLERESMLAAVEDARDRAQLLAQVLGVGIGNVVFASHYSYTPFGPSPCDPTALAYPEYYGGYYDPSQPAEVTLISNVTVTYSIQ